MDAQKPARKSFPKKSHRPSKGAQQRAGSANRSKKEPKLPVEVIVFDVIQKEKVVAEYRHETVQWYGTRMHRVYHPAFKEREDGSRLVFNFVRTLGPLPEEQKTPEQAMKEKAEEAKAAEAFKAA